VDFYIFIMLDVIQAHVLLQVIPIAVLWQVVSWDFL
jgi:hypothetical protein